MAKRYLNNEDEIEFGGALVIGSSAILTPAAISSQEDNYNPTGFQSSGVIQKSYLRLSASGGDQTVTGLAAPNPSLTNVVTVVNVGSTNKITLKNNDGSSTATNRFVFKNDIVLEAGQSVSLFYDAASARWRAEDDYS